MDVSIHYAYSIVENCFVCISRKGYRSLVLRAICPTGRLRPESLKFKALHQWIILFDSLWVPGSHPGQVDS